MAQESIQQQVKLSDCVNMYIDESKQSSKEFRRLWALAFRGLTDIGLDVSWSPKQLAIPVNANATATLPTDYINWVRVGAFNGFGELATLRYNEQLTTYKDNQSNRLSAIQSQTGVAQNYLQFPYWLGGWGDNEYQPGFGAGSGMVQNGDFKVDKANNVILFSPDFNVTQIVLEYVASPIMDDDYSTDLECQEALIAWLRWKDIQSLASNKMVNISEKTMRQREYDRQKKLAKRRIKPFRIMVAEQYFREAQRLAVKG